MAIVVSKIGRIIEYAGFARHRLFLLLSVLFAGSFRKWFNAGLRSRDDGRPSRYNRPVEAIPRCGSNSPAGRSLWRSSVDGSVSSDTY